MSEFLESVNRRTRMVGQNRLELLLFRLARPQIFGINVFKVREVLRCPRLTVMPGCHPYVRGVATVRGVTMPILDLARATGEGELPDNRDCFVIITEYNTTTQGFLVQAVDRIVNMKWEDMHLPPHGSGADSYLTAITEVDGRMIEVLDVEKILVEVSPQSDAVSAEAMQSAARAGLAGLRILVADDSAVARKQVQRCGAALGLEVVQFPDGLQALRHLEALAATGIDVAGHYAMLVSDIEMPEMDGYTLTAEIRKNPALARLRILLHTSLSGVFNRAMVQRVGADDFLPKYSPDELAHRMIVHLQYGRAHPRDMATP